MPIKKGPNLRWSLIQCSGGDEGDRTPDLLTASQALSQLSYAPVRKVLYGNSLADARTISEKLSGVRAGTHPGTAMPRHRPPTRGPSGASPPAPWDARRETGPSTSPGARARGGPPRNPPIYYLWATPPDHTADGKTKTAGRRPAVFAKRGVWSRGRVKK